MFFKRLWTLIREGFNKKKHLIMEFSISSQTHPVPHLVMKKKYFFDALFSKCLEILQFGENLLKHFFKSHTFEVVRVWSP